MYNTIYSPLFKINSNLFITFCGTANEATNPRKFKVHIRISKSCHQKSTIFFIVGVECLFIHVSNDRLHKISSACTTAHIHGQELKKKKDKSLNSGKIGRNAKLIRPSLRPNPTRCIQESKTPDRSSGVDETKNSAKSDGNVYIHTYELLTKHEVKMAG